MRCWPTGVTRTDTEPQYAKPGTSTVALLRSVTAFAGTAAGDPGAEKKRPLDISLEFSSTPGDFECDEGLVPTRFVGSGILSHLGRVEISGRACDDFVNLEITDGFGTYVAANGDSIDVEYTGQALSFTPPDTLSGKGLISIVGGTGRFESATGEAEFIFDTVGNQTSASGHGWIVYDASDRRNKSLTLTTAPIAARR